MYKEKDLLRKVVGHVKEKDIPLLKALIKDIDEFNEKYGNSVIEMYIDFDDVGYEGEFDPYETFSIRLHNKVNSTVDRNVHDALSIHQLDDCLCSIEQYFETVEEMVRETEVVRV